MKIFHFTAMVFILKSNILYQPSRNNQFATASEPGHMVNY